MECDGTHHESFQLRFCGRIPVLFGMGCRRYIRKYNYISVRRCGSRAKFIVIFVEIYKVNTGSRR